MLRVFIFLCALELMFGFPALCEHSLKPFIARILVGPFISLHHLTSSLTYKRVNPMSPGSACGEGDHLRDLPMVFRVVIWNWHFPSSKLAWVEGVSHIFIYDTVSMSISIRVFGVIHLLRLFSDRGNRSWITLCYLQGGAAGETSAACRWWQHSSYGRSLRIWHKSLRYGDSRLVLSDIMMISYFRLIVSLLCS